MLSVSVSIVSELVVPSLAFPSKTIVEVVCSMTSVELPVGRISTSGFSLSETGNSTLKDPIAL